MKKIIALSLMVMLVALSVVMPVSAETAPQEWTTNGNGRKTDIGMWYVTYNTQNEWTNNFGTGYPVRYRMLMPDGSYGILDSKNVNHIDFQLKCLADAKTDFVIFDCTNGGLTDKLKFGWDNGKNGPVEVVRLTCQRIAKWNQTHDWKIKYAIGIGTYSQVSDGGAPGYAAEVQAEGVYKTFIENEEYGGDNYYTVNNKPLLVLFDWTTNAEENWNSYGGDKTYGSKFHMGHADTGSVGSYGWYNRYGAVPDDEVIMIAPGHNTAGESPATIPRNQGKHYKESWEKILTNKLPRMIVISSFNDYNEQTAVFVTDSSNCNEAIEEKWYDSTGKVNNAMYWNMTIEGIRLVEILNGDAKGELKSNWFNLGGKAATNNASSSNMTIIIVVIATAAVILIAGLVVVLVLVKGKKKK